MQNPASALMLNYAHEAAKFHGSPKIEPHHFLEGTLRFDEYVRTRLKPGEVDLMLIKLDEAKRKLVYEWAGGRYPDDPQDLDDQDQSSAVDKETNEHGSSKDLSGSESARTDDSEINQTIYPAPVQELLEQVQLTFELPFSPEAADLVQKAQDQAQKRARRLGHLRAGWPILPDYIAALENHFQENGQNEVREMLVNSPLQDIAAYLREKALKEPYILDMPKGSYRKILAVNYNELSARGELDAIIGREKEYETILSSLATREHNKVMVTSPPQYGKSFLLQGLGQKISDGNVPPALKDYNIVGLQKNALGNVFINRQDKQKKEFLSEGEALSNFLREIDQEQGRVVLAIDDADELLESNTTKTVLKNWLQTSSTPAILTMPANRFRNNWDELGQRGRSVFGPVVRLEPLSSEEAREALSLQIDDLEKSHDIFVKPQQIDEAVDLAERFCAKPSMVEARSLLDRAMAAQKVALSYIDEDQHDDALRTLKAEYLYKATSDHANVPIDMVGGTERERMIALPERLRQNVFEQDEAVEDVSEALIRSVSGLHEQTERPRGSFLFLGPTGVGKTELARQLNTQLFGGSEESLIKIDMSEYRERHSSQRLVGSPPGYIGHNDGGQLTNAVRKRPHAVVLFDEIEKAHPDVLNMMLQILEDGCLTDGHGEKVDFSNTVVIMTSNLGAHVKTKTLGFGSAVEFSADSGQDKQHEAYMEELRRALRPELINRFDSIVSFHGLSQSAMDHVAKKFWSLTAKGLAKKNIQWHVTEEAWDYIRKKGGAQADEFGARPMRRLIEKEIEGPLAHALVEGTLKDGGAVVIDRDPDAGAQTEEPESRASGLRFFFNGEAQQKLVANENMIVIQHQEDVAKGGSQPLAGNRYTPMPA